MYDNNYPPYQQYPPQPESFDLTDNGYPDRKLTRKEKKALKKQNKQNRPPKKKMPIWKKLLIAFFILVVLALAGAYGYYNYVLYPPLASRDEETAGLSAVNRWNSYISNKDFEGLEEEIGTDSYLNQEFSYANENEDVTTFINNVLSTVTYEVPLEQGIDIYGNVAREKGTGDTIYVQSLMNDADDELTVHYIDYSQIQFNSLEISNFLKTAGLTVGSADYHNQVVYAFCQYMNSLSWADIPTTTEKHTIAIAQDSEGYEKMTSDEDIYLDKLLFSSDAFYDMLDRFDVAANGGAVPTTEAWNKWNKLEDKKKSSTQEPTKYAENTLISQEWLGAYHLQNEVENVVLAQSGDGTVDKPAAIGTSILTYVLQTKDGKTVAKPIRVELTEILYDADCVSYLAEKDSRNRGIDTTGQISYAYLKFTVTNLSDEKLHITDNSSLADKQGNLSARTGTMYGLTSSITLAAGESGTIETWVSSTELNRKYLIWGADFNKQVPSVYFKVFAEATTTDAAKDE
jgi:hypothetical protein